MARSNGNGKKRITNADVYAEVTALKVAVCGHPDVPNDEGLFGDVKYIREQIEDGSKRTAEAERAIAEINTRCEERHGLKATVNQASSKISKSVWKKIAGITGIAGVLITLIWYIGTAVGWW